MDKYIIRYGLYIYMGIAGLFLVMKVVNLEQVTFLRFLNVFILIFFSIRLAKSYSMQKEGMEYLNGLANIFLANLVAIVLSAMSLGIYLKFSDPSIIENLNQSIWLAGDLTILKIAGAVFIEGTASAVIISFGVMQYYKQEIQTPIKKHQTIKKFEKSIWNKMH